MEITLKLYCAFAHIANTLIAYVIMLIMNDTSLEEKTEVSISFAV